MNQASICPLFHESSNNHFFSSMFMSYKYSIFLIFYSILWGYLPSYSIFSGFWLVWLSLWTFSENWVILVSNDGFLLYNKRWLLNSIDMHGYFMFFQISLLCKGPFADVTFKRSWLCVLAVVILDVACLFKYLVAFVVSTSKILFIFMWMIVQDFDDVNHVYWNFF